MNVTCRLVDEIEDVRRPTLGEIMNGRPFPLGDHGNIASDELTSIIPESDDENIHQRFLIIRRDDSETWAVGQEVEVYPVARRGLSLVVCDEPALRGAFVA